MSKNFKLFLVVIFLSFPFWWGINFSQENLENFLYSRMIEKNPPSFFIAQISLNYPEPQNLQISAESAISVELDKTGQERIIFKKRENKKMAIASLTKLMTAVIASEFYQLDLEVKISEKAVSQPEQTGNLRIDERLKVEDLLHIMLIESSNDAAFALAEIIGTEGFIALMNLKAKDIGLLDSRFFNPTGLDKEDSGISDQTNYSTARDIVKLTRYLLRERLILNIISKKEYELRFKNGVLHHVLENTNQLLGENPEIIGGKTGFTEEAGECLILITENKKSETYLISIVLNSKHRFEDIKKLIEYAN